MMQESDLLGTCEEGLDPLQHPPRQTEKVQ